jgi:hypothetical protein
MNRNNEDKRYDEEIEGCVEVLDRNCREDESVDSMGSS